MEKLGTQILASCQKFSRGCPILDHPGSTILPYGQSTFWPKIWHFMDDFRKSSTWNWPAIKTLNKHEKLYFWVEQFFASLNPPVSREKKLMQNYGRLKRPKGFALWRLLIGLNRTVKLYTGNLRTFGQWKCLENTHVGEHLKVGTMLKIFERKSSDENFSEKYTEISIEFRNQMCKHKYFWYKILFLIFKYSP